MSRRLNHCRSFLCAAISIIVVAFMADARAENEPPAATALVATSTLLLNTNIGDIAIVNENIFDLTNPAENRALYRLANALHSKTDADVIARQLLFSSGDPFDPQKLAESERLLRKTRYLGDVTIRPVRLRNNVVDIEVHTSDDWTLKPSLSFGRKGGVNSGGLGIEEYNLFGRGTHIGAEFKSDIDRDSLALQFSDRNLLGSRFVLLAEYANNSDGFDHRLTFEKPFYALGSQRAGGVSMRNGQEITTIYDRGRAVRQFGHSFLSHDAYFGWSKGLRQSWTRRLVGGLHIEEHQFRQLDLPLGQPVEIADSRRFVYPYIGVQLLEDDFDKTRNVDQIGRVEDRHLGAAMALKLGYSSTAMGSSSDALMVEAAYSNALRASRKSVLSMESRLKARIGERQANNMLLELAARYDLRQSEKRLLHARISANVGKNLDQELPLYLGGGSGLRGYPLRYLSGDRTVLLTVEQRLFTDWYPFQIFRVGAAIFVDAGRSWGQQAAGSANPGWLKNAGVGLRLGNTRSSVGRVIHIDLAMPLGGDQGLDKVQLQIEAKRSF